MKRITPNEQINANLELIKVIDSRLRTAPEGELHIRKHRNGFQYWIKYLNSNNKLEYIKAADKEKLGSYVKKYYYSKLKKTIEEDNRFLSKAVRYDPNRTGKVYDDLPPNVKQYVTPLCKSVATQIKEWYEKDFQKNTYDFSPAPSYTTQKGETVRSRAELIIANELNAHDLYYHYEEALTLSNGKKRYPDFKVAHPKTGEFYYIEFFGMMDNAKYALDAFTKINEYSNDSVFPKMIFIFDYAGAPFTNTTVTNIIKTYFS